jgi:hypothetical protein
MMIKLEIILKPMYSSEKDPDHVAKFISKNIEESFDYEVVAFTGTLMNK